MNDEEESIDVVLEQAQRVVDNQNETIGDLDAKAVALLRLDVVLVGAAISTLSVASRLDTGTTGRLFNGYTVAGGILLLCSTVTAAATYTASGIKIGPSSADLWRMATGEHDAISVKTGLARSYATWIELNYRTNVRTVPLLTLAVVSLVVAVVLFSLGITKAVVGDLPAFVGGVTVVSVLLFARQARLFRQLSRLSRVGNGSR